jgi:hypothetical protein
MKRQQDIDYMWFTENFDNLYQEYGESYLIIKQRSVIGAYKNHSEAYANAIKSNSLGTFIIQKVCANIRDLTEYIVGPIAIIENSNKINSNNTDC